MSSDSEITSLSGCVFRVFWIILGPVLLLVCAVVIATSQDVRFPGVLDIIYGGLLALVILARLLDRPPKQKTDDPKGTASSDPEGTVSSELRRDRDSEYKAGLDSALKYISTLSFCAIGLWALAHFVVKRII